MDYSKIYDSIILNAKLYPRSIGENHHILPRSMGGKDTKENIVKLTHREHFICHILLFKIHKNRQMAFALGRMSNASTEYGVGARAYEFARKAFIERVSTQFKTTIKNKVVVRNINTGECELIDRNYDKDKYVGVNKGRKFTDSGNKGHAVYKDSNGKRYRLKVDDPLIQELRLKGIGNTVNATKVAAEKMLSRPWYLKPLVTNDMILFAPTLFDWYNIVYDVSKPKSTGLKRCLDYNGVKMSKVYAKLFDMFKNGYKLDSGFYEVYNERKIK